MSLSKSYRWLNAFGFIPIAFVAVLLVYPFIVLVQAVLQNAATGQNSTAAISFSAAVQIAFSSAVQALLSTIATLILGLPLSWLLSRFQFAGRRIIQTLLLIPFVLPTVVTGLAIKQLTSSWISPGLSLLIAAHVLVNLAVVVRVVVPIWENFDRRYEVQAASFGMHPLQVFRRVTFPAIRPAVIQTAAIVFAYTFSSLGLVLILGGGQRTLESQLLRQIALLLDFSGAAVSAILQFVIVAFVLLIGVRAKSEYRSNRKEIRQNFRGGLFFTFGIVAILVFVYSPLLINSVSANQDLTFTWWRQLFENPEIPGVGIPAVSLLNTLKISVLTGAVTSLVAVSVGLFALKGKIQSRISAVASLPMTISAATLGLGVLLAFARAPFNLSGNWWLMPMAHSLAALPLASAFAVIRFRTVNSKLLLVAQSLGTNSLQSFFAVFKYAILKVSAVTFAIGAAISIGEFGAASFLSDPQNPTAPVLIMRLLGNPGEQSIGIASALAIALAFSTLLLVSIISRFERSE